MVERLLGWFPEAFVSFLERAGVEELLGDLIVSSRYR